MYKKIFYNCSKYYYYKKYLISYMRYLLPPCPQINKDDQFDVLWGYVWDNGNYRYKRKSFSDENCLVLNFPNIDKIPHLAHPDWTIISYLPLLIFFKHNAQLVFFPNPFMAANQIVLMDTKKIAN